MLEEWKQKVENPSSWYRSFPFWAWNDKMEEAELISQVRGMKESGMGGFFIHSRDGLETEYLGKEWFSCMKAVIREAEKQEMKVWLYDEDRWPSGTAGGRVTAKGDAYRCKGLTLEILEADSLSEVREKELKGLLTGEVQDDHIGLLALYAAEISGMDILTVRRLTGSTGEAVYPHEKLLAVRQEVSAPSEWFNHEAPPDNLNPDCVRDFIKETHEVYAAEVGEWFGTVIPGIFSDEPSLHDRHAYFGEKKAWIPWSYGISAYFKEQRGYDFFDVLPYFYFHHMKSTKVRHDYWHTITVRYSETYYKIISDWCEAHGLLFTGHLLQEDKLGLCTRVNGAAMPHYRYMHVPGIDMLCEQTEEYMTVKQCTSVAHQLGMKQTLTETYGCTGWDFTFEGQKWMGDWQFVLGINRRCQHVAHYSIRGLRKRDYPPCFNYQNSWLDKNKIVEDYFARLSAAMEEGEAVRNILLLHPAATAWSRFGVNPYGNPVRRQERDVPELNEFGDAFNSLIEFLVKQHYDCDLGDELLIEQYGQAEGKQFRIGQGVYDIVIVPGVDTILASTYEKLLAYVEQGGKLCFLPPMPDMLAGEKKNMDALCRHPNCITADTKEELAELLAEYRTVRLEDSEGRQQTRLLYQLRRTGEGYLLFVVNNDRTQAVWANIKLPFAGSVSEYDLLSGEVRSCQVCTDGLDTSIKAYFAKTDSKLYVITEIKEKIVEILPQECPIELSEDNVLPLDVCTYKIKGEALSEEMEVWQAQLQIREKLGMRQNHENGLEQRYKWIHETHPADGTEVELVFRFYSEEEWNDLKLGVEELERYTITCNGEKVRNDAEGWMIDKACRQLFLPRVKKGENVLTLSCAYTLAMEMENIYLTGNFGVDTSRRLTAAPKSLRVGDWGKQGLLHYCGNVTYRYLCHYAKEEGSKVFLQVPKISALYMNIWVNGTKLFVPWKMEEPIAIGEYMQNGQNDIGIEIAGSPVNRMGPFHLKEGKPYNTNSSTFCPPQDKYTTAYHLKPYGMMEPARIYVSRAVSNNQS